MTGLQGIDPTALPRPIAQAYLRLMHERSDHGRINRALKLLEVALVHATWLAVSRVFELPAESREQKLLDMLPKLARPGLGDLVGLVVELDRFLRSVSGAWMDLEQPASRPRAEGRRESSARQVLNELVALRNEVSHRTLGAQGAAEVVEPVIRSVGAVLDALGLIRLAAPILVLSCEVATASRTPRRQAEVPTRYSVRGEPLAGTGRQPPVSFDATSPVDTGLVYQPFDEGRLMLLHPFVQVEPRTDRFLTLRGYRGSRMTLLDVNDGTREERDLSAEDAADLAPLFRTEAGRDHAEPEGSLLGGLDDDMPPAGRSSSASGPSAPPSGHGGAPKRAPSLRGGIPEVLGGRYRILERLGAGAAGTVYRAEHLATGQISAIKMLSRDAEHDPSMSERFEREARTLAKLEHPGFVSMRDFGEEEGSFYLVMEYAAGGSLDRRLAESGPMPMLEGLRLVEDAARALAFAHVRGVVHRDLKPGNLLFTEQGDIKIADFGLVHIRDAAASLTGVGAVVGTVHYMAPEQIRGDTVDGRTDIYALGAILFEILTGRPPYQGATVYAIQQQHLDAPPPSIRTCLPGAPMELEQLIARAMAKQPKARFPDAEAIVAALADLRGRVASMAAQGRRPDPAPAPGTHATDSRVLPRSSAGSNSGAGRSAIDPASLPPGAAGFSFYRNQAVSFERLTDLHYRATSHIKATRFSDRAVQDRSRYWQAVLDRAHDPEIAYHRLTSVRSDAALRSVLRMVEDLANCPNFHLALTSAVHPFEIVLRDGEEAVFCFHKSDFVVYASLGFDGEADPVAQRIVQLYETMFDEIWAEAELVVSFRRDVGGSPERILQTQERIRLAFPHLSAA